MHIAAAGCRQEIAQRLIATDANVRARNPRCAEPLYYAADGVPGSRILGSVPRDGDRWRA